MREIIVAVSKDVSICTNVIFDEMRKHGTVVVVIRKYEENLSAIQRGLYWRWVGAICGTTGDTKIDFHHQYKLTVFFNIFLADPGNHADLCAAVEAMKRSRLTMLPTDYEIVKKVVLKECSHLNATVANMRDVLKQLEADADSLGIVLPPTPKQECLCETELKTKKKKA